MEAIDCGWLSILPPIIAIVLALLTKEVISSLIIGILAGGLIYTGFNVIGAVDVTFNVMAEKMGGNSFILLFLALLGALVVVVTKAGGSRAYGQWAVTKLKSRTGAQLATSALGALIFIDDYFNCLTVGTVMRPVTDKHRISRAKLAYLIDSTAAPICIIAPVSSWAAAIAGFMTDAGIEDGLGTFVQTIPYNLYAILTILMILVLVFTKMDFGTMRRFERKAQEQGDLDAQEGAIESTEEFDGTKISDKGRVFDLVIPIVALIVFSILGMLYVGGLFTGGAADIAEAFANTDASAGLTLGGFAALVVAFLLFVPRRVLSFRDFMEGITQGVKSMVPAFIILILAWTISGMCRDLLSTGEFVGNLVQTSNISLQLLPAIVFVVAGFLAFAMGTSWGTFGILIPIVVIICGTNSPYLIPSLAATLAGAVYGDHCSPISDTTILSSTGAGCNHIDHVSSQMGYATLVAIVCFIGYLVAGLTENLFITLGVSVVLLGAVLAVAFYLTRRREARG